MTRVLLLQRLSEGFDDWWSGTTTGAGSATTIVDTALAQLSQCDDDFCVNWYVRNVATGQIRRIPRTAGYVDSTNTITHASMTAVGNAAAYELHRINPTLKHNALLRASVLCFPSGARHGLYLPLRDESLIVDNLLLNASLDTFSTTFTNWTNIGTPTLDDETTRKVHGSGSASIVASGATEGIEQNIFTSVNLREAVGKGLQVQGWTFATVASAVRLRVTFNGSTYTNGEWNSGDAEWEHSKFSATIPADATEITVSCEVTDGNTGYFDLVRAWVDPIYRYTIPTTMLRGPFEVLQQAYEDLPEGPYLPIPKYGTPTPGRVLRLTGMGLLGQPVTDATTVEIDTNQAEYFLAQASQWLYRAILKAE